MGIQPRSLTKATLLTLVLVVNFQNCSPAQFSTSGTESKNTGGNGDLGDGGITPDPGGGPGGGSGGDSGGGSCQELCGPNLIVNGDFELVDDSMGLVNGRKLNELLYRREWDVYPRLPDGNGGVSWYAEDGTSGIEVQASNVTQAASGKRNIELDSHPNGTLGNHSNSGMYQVLNLAEGGSFVLAFKYFGRSKSAASNEIQVVVDDKVVKSIAKASCQSSWSEVKVPLQLSKGAHRIGFRASGLQDTYGGLIDLISLRKYCAHTIESTKQE